MENDVDEIIKARNPLYVVVRFELKAGELETLASTIQEFFRKEVSLFPGFISARIHTNQERTVLINYATWESLAHFQKFFQEVGAKSEFGKKIQAYNPRTDRVFEIPL